MPSCVLAYSGGLDTSVILGWLQDEGYDVHCVYVDLGQPCEDREAIMKKAHDNGAKSAKLIDAREELCRDFAFPVMAWQAKYEGIYLLGTSIARPLISKVCLQVAREVGAEAYAHGAPARVAVQHGLRAGRSVVTAAAIIMISVFAGFIFSHDATIKPIGFGLAFGVLLDAFVVRMLLIPAAMHLLGESAWWLPRWLDRLLPDVDVEGAKLERSHPVHDEPHGGPVEERPGAHAAR